LKYITYMSPGSANEIALVIERRILSGGLGSGERLHSVRDLANELGVAAGTVAAAYRQLAETGLIIAGRGRQGTRVAPRPTAGLGSSMAGNSVPTGLVDARHGSPDPALLPDFAAALIRAAHRTTNAYGSALVLDELAEAVVATFETDGVPADHLTVTNGSMDAIDRVLRAHSLRIGDRVGVEDPGHIPVHQLVRSAGLVPVPLSVDDEGIEPSAVERALSTRLAAVILTPRAQNPTGAALTADRAADLSAVLDGHPEVLLIQDDHAGSVAGPDYVQVTPPGPRWVTIRSVGKSLSPDLRLACLVGDGDTIGRVSAAFANGPGWVSHVLQAATADLLTDPVAQKQVALAATTYGRRRSRLIGALAEFEIPSSGTSGFNVWVPGVNVQAAVEAARAAGYVIADGDPWRISSESAVRITTNRLTNLEIDEIAAAIESTVRRQQRRAASA
jgi:DNA-binding transcriptional MocR family regulator